MKQPQLSVIITCYNEQDSITRCLESLKQQETNIPFEIIVVDSSTDGTADIVAHNFPTVRLFRFAERKFCGEARNIGVSVAKTDILAFTDADCTVDVQWVEHILTAHHQSKTFVIGGTIANGATEALVGWAAYFTEYSHWMPAPSGHWIDDAAGANMSYKKLAFEQFGGFFEGGYGSDTDFHWRLRRAGYRIWFEPSIRVTHHGHESFAPFISHEILHGSHFARMRVRNQRFSWWRRWIYALLCPFIAGRIIEKIVWNVLNNPMYLSQFLRSLPILMTGISAWSIGEAVGYLTSRCTHAT
ncbi:MAG: glycosyltransferase [bacterium]|nr:glycosyltransferase [bacterium]